MLLGRRTLTHVLRRVPVVLMATLAAASPASAGWRVIAWNDLGMHCMDSSYAVFSILPPYNNLHAQIVDASGRLVTSPGTLSVTWEAVADASGSRNTTSVGKTDFWSFVAALYGADLAPDHGLAGSAMPGTGNTPQPMSFDVGAHQFVASGIPITAYDDSGRKNAYPMVRVVVRDGSGAILASTDVVLPISDEMDCRACHGSGSSAAAQPAAGWVTDPDPDRDYRLNILRLHDDLEGWRPRFASALTEAGYSADGLYATVTAQGTPVLCARCHGSNALPGTGLADIPPLTHSVHGKHAQVEDPVNGLTLDASSNRSACYRCHPGSETRCLRGAMGSAVAADGSLAIQCQSCHGSMSAVGGNREGWLDEPGCGGCHTGTATANSGQIRYTSALLADGSRRQPADSTFATNPDTPSAGFSLYRFSDGHGGLACEACHGSTHAEYPSLDANDNAQSLAVQGHVGSIGDCTACHASSPSTTSGGPHGMHPVGQDWVSRHGDAAEHSSSACQVCHGADSRGTVLSRALGPRSLSTKWGSRTFFRGATIGCYTCHNGPSSESGNPNHPPTVASASISTTHDTPVTVTLSATDADGDSLTVRIVTQPRHGTVALSGRSATYLPEAGFGGTDSFTFAAWDGASDSNLATVSVSVSAAALAVSAAASPSSGQTPLEVHFSATVSGGTEPYSYDWDFGDGSAHAVTSNPTHTYTADGTFPVSVSVRDAVDITASDSHLAVTVGSTAVWRYLVPAAAHNTGVGGTLWQTDLVAVVPGSQSANLEMEFRFPGGQRTAVEVLAAGSTVVWTNAAESLFGLAPSEPAAGVIEVTSDAPVVLSARTFNSTATGTFGQSMPVLDEAAALHATEEGVLPHIVANAKFRSNLGLVNLGNAPCTATVRLFGGSGTPLGQSISETVSARGWTQLNNIGDLVGAGQIEIAYATVSVDTPGGAMWAYVSLIDQATGDPTTIPVVRRP